MLCGLKAKGFSERSWIFQKKLPCGSPERRALFAEQASSNLVIKEVEVNIT